MLFRSFRDFHASELLSEPARGEGLGVARGRFTVRGRFAVRGALLRYARVRDLERCEVVLRRVDACAPVLQQSAGVFENGTRICSSRE